MIEKQIDPIILGHNPFFGVDHLSQEQGNVKSERFEDRQKLADMLLYCHNLGIRGMMMSTHPRASVVAEIIQNEPTLASSWRVYPLVPYIQKYVRGANEKGLVNMIQELLSQTTVKQKLSLIWRGSQTLLDKDIQQGLSMLIDIELAPLNKCQFGAVFLHDTLTDLALGMGVESVLEVFRDHVRKQYGVPAAFTTKNLPLFRRRTEAMGWKDTLVMASFNKKGFYVNPSLEECGKEISREGIKFIAMSSLASGALSPDAAYQYLSQYPVASVVVGMSRKEHAEETVRAIKQHMKMI